MGFLGTIPADSLAAVYSTSERKLTLFAAGTVQQFTSGFNFRQDPLMGGLKFTLQAWTGPLSGKDQVYEYQQSFNIGLPSPVYPSGNVIIVTANHPDGVVVPIHYLGLQPLPKGLTAGTDAHAAMVANDGAAAQTVPGSTQLNVLYKTTFDIRANAQVPTQGSVDISYDPAYLQLVSSRIVGPDHVWTFLAIQMGDTQAVVTTYGGIAQFVMQQTYDIRIFVL